jgi:hypothetical protein
VRQSVGNGNENTLVVGNNSTVYAESRAAGLVMVVFYLFVMTNFITGIVVGAAVYHMTTQHHEIRTLSAAIEQPPILMP